MMEINYIKLHLQKNARGCFVKVKNILFFFKKTSSIRDLKPDIFYTA